MKKNDLTAALEIVKPGLSGNEVIEQSTSFAFINGRVTTYNDEISISHPVSGLDITGAIKAEELYQYLKKVKTEEIEIEITGNEIILISGKARAGLILQQEIKLPLEEIGNMGKWKTLPSNFLKGLKFTIPSCSSMSSRPILTCVHVSDKGYVEASDSFRISRLTLDKDLLVKTFLLPSSSAQTVLKLAPIKVAEGVGWVHFMTESGTILSCRIFEDKFPDMNPYTVVEGEKIALKETISEVLERAMVFSKRDDSISEMVTLTFKDGILEVTSESEIGWFKETIRIKWKGSLSFNITPSLLRDILKETQEFTFNKHALRFEGEDWFFVVALKAASKV
jgi:DNA polymerase III sliding clamp (beta) subunit (PCNA family)